ncbi:AbrB/MazE/SpoVT family DNA-binding domain-containing protein [Candidatus Daviesbacteria bacterium]|nr:AbrB/MazE/SpoVT family DNA-binding domain-containing protein [Candidatus Daviesbacteria bacterium]
MQIQTSVNVKYQVVIPKEARKKINLKPGQKMNVDVVGGKVVLSKASKKKEWKWPDDYIKRLGGIWKSSEDIEKYLEEQDKSWE